MKHFLSQFASKTVLTGLVGAAQYVLQNDYKNPMTWVNAVTGVFLVASVRQAIAKSGPTGQ